MPIKKLLEHNALFIAIFFTILVALISLVSLKDVHLIKTHNSDKYGHFLAYFINYIIIIILISYGIILEVLQDILTNHRQADLYDIVANSIGVIFAVLVYNKLKKKM